MPKELHYHYLRMESVKKRPKKLNQLESIKKIIDKFANKTGFCLRNLQ